MVIILTNSRLDNIGYFSMNSVVVNNSTCFRRSFDVRLSKCLHFIMSNLNFVDSYIISIFILAIDSIDCAAISAGYKLFLIINMHTILNQAILTIFCLCFFESTYN